MRDEMAQFGVYSAQLKKRIINARSETIADKQLFADAFRLRRCLVPASGWYEWDITKQPHHIQLMDGRVMGFAGVMFGSQKIALLSSLRPNLTGCSHQCITDAR
jgi:putative SOS response-associated peptidase YedK